MEVRVRLSRPSLTTALVLLAASSPLLAADGTLPSGSPVLAKAFQHPALRVEADERPVSWMAMGDLAAGLQAQLASLGASGGTGFYDWRDDRWGSLVVSVPLLPGDGAGN